MKIQTYCLCECERVEDTKRELCDNHQSCIDTRRGSTILQVFFIKMTKYLVLAGNYSMSQFM